MIIYPDNYIMLICVTETEIRNLSYDWHENSLKWVTKVIPNVSTSEFKKCEFLKSN